MTCRHAPAASAHARPAHDGLVLERGCMRDYHALAHFHYRHQRPATALRIYRIVNPRPTVVDRFLNRAASGEVLGVLVVSLPHLGCAAREHALGQRYGGLPLGVRARVLNREVRTISRVIVDPRCRGMGLGVRLVRAALAEADTRFTEALAAMGRANPFFERAGMRRFEPPESAHGERLRAAMESLALPRALLASRCALDRALAAHPADARAWFAAELARCAGRSGGRNRHQRPVCARPGRTPPAGGIDETHLQLARLHIFGRPVYYLADHATRTNPLPHPQHTP